LPSPLLSLRRHAQLLLALAVTLLLATWLLSADALAATTGTTPGKGEDTPLNLPEDATSGASSSAGGGGLARTIVGLLVVIAVIYGITWVLRQLKASREDDAFGAGLGNAATLPLGTGRALHLVRAGNEWLLLGVTDGGIAPLRTYTEAEARAAGLPIESDAADELRPAHAPAGPGPLAFVERLRDLTVRR
jgi:flagellar protein FliO/FliZ